MGGYKIYYFNRRKRLDLETLTTRYGLLVSNIYQPTTMKGTSTKLIDFKKKPITAIQNFCNFLVPFAKSPLTIYGYQQSHA